MITCQTRDMGNGNVRGNAPRLPGTSLAQDPMAAVTRAVANGDCILFLGAGIHYPPPIGSPYEESYPPSVRPVLAKRLAKVLARHCKLRQTHPDEVHDRMDLARIASFYEIACGRATLIAAIRHSTQRRKRPSAALRALAELDFPLVLTTNYDHLIEDALTQAVKDPRKGVYNPDRLIPTVDALDDFRDPRQPFVFKVHGDIDNGNSLVITDENYIHFTLRMGDREELHPVPEAVRFSLRRRPTLFIGYRLVDYNLRLLFKTLRWKLDAGGDGRRNAGYAVDPYPDPLIVEQYANRERCIQFIVQDLWTFVPELYQRVKGRPMPP